MKAILPAALLCVCAAAAVAQGVPQNPPPDDPARESEDEVIRVNTALIQTGVAVFDKKGQFVGGLKREDFELTVEGKPVPISFFEEYEVRRRREVKGAGGAAATPAAPAAVTAAPPGRGRNILFVVDDLHLSFDSHNRIRKMISRFVEQEMAAEDTVAVVSSTGKIGFLQQFTDNRAVLRAAVGRLKFTRDHGGVDRGQPPMTEYEAWLISQFDPQVTDIFAAQEMGSDMESKRQVVRSRARTILSQAAVVNRRTYSTLEQAVRNSSQLPGRKVIFFISDGWVLDPSNTDSTYRMRRIADAAARTNAVIYSFDAKGLDAGSSEGGTSGMVGYRVAAGERFDKQDGLNYLAEKTGGRLIRNTNDLQGGLAKSIVEASQHYLLAWQPASESAGSEKWRRIEVRIKNRPDLKVRVHGGFLDNSLTADDGERKEAEAKKGDAARQAAVPVHEQQLDAAARALTTARALPVSLSVNYLDLPEEGTQVTVSLQIESDAVAFSPEAGAQAKASIDILGLIYNADGKREKYLRELLTVEATASAKTQPRAIYHTYQAKLLPGLYQVRVAARDAKSGKVGSAARWLEVPDLSARKLATSSLMISERAADAAAARAGGAAVAAAAGTRVAVDHRVARDSNLRYIMFVYNASRGKAGAQPPDVTVQTQVLRGGEVVVTSPASPISVGDKDPDRLPYAAEISLDGLPAGRYELLVRVQDRVAKADSTQRVSFEIR